MAKKKIKSKETIRGDGKQEKKHIHNYQSEGRQSLKKTRDEDRQTGPGRQRSGLSKAIQLLLEELGQEELIVLDRILSKPLLV